MAATSHSACRAKSTARTTSASSARRRITSRACWSGAAFVDGRCERIAGRTAVDKAAGSVLVAALLLAAEATRGEAPPQAVPQSSQDAEQLPRAAEPARLAARG